MTIISNSSINLLYINFDKVQQREISLFDFSGNCLRKTSITNETEARISLEGVSNGVYILQVNGFFQKVYVS